MRVVAFAALCTGCFGPQLDGISCETTGLCPDGLVCDQNLCIPDPFTQICGDGIRNAGERCDDGNSDDGDGCSGNCAVATCTAPITHPTVQSLIDDPACTSGYLSPGRYFEQVVIDRHMTLEGAGFGDIAIDGNGFGRPIEVLGGRAVTLRNFTIRNGLAVAGGGIRNDGLLALESMTVTANLATGSDAAGGGIWHRQGSLVIRGSLIADNRVEASGGSAQIGGGGGVLAEASLTVTGGSRFEGNVVEVAGADTLARGGAIDARGAVVVLDGCELIGNLTEALAAPPAISTSAIGGAIAADDGALLAIADCAISGNRLFASGPTESLSARGGAIHLIDSRADLRAGVDLRDNQLTLSGPGATARGAGGGLFAERSVVAARELEIGDNLVSAAGQAPSDDVRLEAGGLFSTASSCRITGATIGGGVTIEVAGDRADVALVNSTITGSFGPGIEVRDLGAAGGSLQLLNLTIAGNAAGLAVDQALGAPVAITLASSIVADSCDTTSPVLLGDYNLLADACGFAGAPQNNLVGVDPLLGPLADNGGPNETLRPDATSPAIDAGAEPACVDPSGATLAVDQRGLPRPTNGRCDIGAVERQ